ncbi:hypothetical protein CRUP_031944, partial [Coryphaenoides rupestris]
RLDRTASPSTSSIDSASEPREGRGGEPRPGERGMRGGGGGESLLQRLQSLPGNELCSDCSQAAPCWASINLGVLLCIECSGIHRSLGVHCSKVRSLTLDSWEPELLKLMCELGNTVINHIYEGSCETLGAKKPGPTSPRQEKEAWIKAKYVERRFLKKMSSSEALVEGERKSRPWTVKKSQQHRSSLRAPNKARRKYHRYDPSGPSPANLSAAAAAAAAAKFRRDSLFCPDELDSLFSYFDTGSGPRKEESEESSSGDVEIEQEVPSDPEDPRELHPGALLHRSSRLHNLPLMAEALAHGADVHAPGEQEHGRTPLIHAVVGRGASQTEVDEQGHDPLNIAVQAANADIVTLLRLARMNEEMREAEPPLGHPGQYPGSSPTEQQYRKGSSERQEGKTQGEAQEKEPTVQPLAENDITQVSRVNQSPSDQLDM